MAKPLTAPAVLRAAMNLGAVPPDADVSRRGEVRWESEGLAYLGWISKDAADMLAWHMNVGDARFGSALEKYGRMSVPIRSSCEEMSWPQVMDSSLEGFLREGLGRAAQFVTGRIDLCELLSSRENVQRGDLYVWLPVANYPARLVQALVLARDLGEPDLESRILVQLEQGPIRLSNGRSMDVLGSAKRWASRYSGVLGFDIPI
ncbi:hypothetical protein ACFRR7_25515 [Streptomyces sp. NPDC056909]|uniref:hypothetical protein n=1 Tax=Streptomyces sp. NPDC056909 TaxID=3345963 RepID=UPI00367F8B45